MGGNINGFDAENRTQLMQSARDGNVSKIRLLFMIPSLDVNLKNNHGLTALHFAARFERTDAIKELLKHPEIDPNIKDNVLLAFRKEFHHP